MHIDDWIDDSWNSVGDKDRQYARWMFNHFRLPATLRSDFDQFMEGHKLFCKYKNHKYRVTGASRMGDIWLAKDFNRDCGYDHRVDVEDCSEWSRE